MDFKSDAQRRAYETSLKEHRRIAALAYKLTGGRLNDPPKRRTIDLSLEELQQKDVGGR